MVYLRVSLYFIKDQIRFIICMILTYPLGYINYYLTNPTLRLLYGLIPGLILQYFMYGPSNFK